MRAPRTAADATQAPAWKSVPLQTTLTASGLSFPVDVVRDTYGNPHIYGNSLPDISYAQGYMVAHDRLIQLDFERHSADGTLSYLIGGASPSVVAQDVQMRIHHLRDQAQATYSALQASTDPTDLLLKATLDAFANGVNAYWADLNAGVYSLPVNYGTVYQAGELRTLDRESTRCFWASCSPSSSPSTPPTTS